MTPQQLVGIGARLFAVWLALASLSYFAAIPAALEGMPGVRSVAVIGVMAVAYSVGAVFLWFFPMAAAHKLLPHTKFENRLSLNTHELARVGASLMGLWLLATALPSLALVAFRSALFMEEGSSFSSMAPDAKLDVAAAVFQVVLAVFLIARLNAFATLVVPEVKSSAGDE